MKPRPSLDLAGTAEFLKSGACKSVYVLTGAGASTGAGIPDFRSPGGMYDSLRPELITATEAQRKRMRMDPVNVVMKDMFFQNQFPYLEVRRPFILGTQQQQWKATLTHWFMRFLEEEGLLKRLFTQNIDGLDYQTGISPELVTNVHGSLARVSCEGCGYEMPFDDFCAQVRTNVKDIYRTDPTAPAESSNINCPRFFEQLDDLNGADLLIVAGTSLVVSPANSVVMYVAKDCLRLIVNKEPVGQDLGIRYGKDATRDVWAGEVSCDEAFLDLIKMLGWQDKVRKIKHLLPESNQAMVKDL
ncbi:sirt2 [Symbiodinium sp. KB8]|nr:sirt2 [Symbiodinium sp. KB8]